MQDKYKLLEDIHYLKYKYSADDSAINKFVDKLLEIFNDNYIVNKNQLNNFLNVTESKTTAFGEDAIKLTTGVTVSAICRNRNIPKKELKDYLCTQFGYQLEHLDENVSKVIEKKSDIDSEEKKMIKFLNKELNIKNLSELKEWYENYEFKEECRMNEALDRYYNGRW